MGVSGSTSTLGGRHNSGSAGSSGSSSSASAGKQAAGGEYALGGEGPMGPEDGGEGPIGPGGAPGMPGMPHEPPKPPGGMGGAGGAGPDCPDEPPTDKAECTTKLKCDYPKLACNCDGPEADRTWKCKEPPKPMTMCPPMAPAEGSACKSKEPAAPPCHYEEPVADCNCVNDEWTCAK